MSPVGNLESWESTALEKISLSKDFAVPHPLHSDALHQSD
jgi:hypothetical protein